MLSRFPQKYRLLYMFSLLSLMLLAACLLLLQVPQIQHMKRLAFGPIAYPEDFTQAQNVASHFGYLPGSEIGIDTACLISLPDCGILVVYYTDTPLDTFANSVSLDGYTMDLQSDSLSYVFLERDIGRAGSRLDSINLVDPKMVQPPPVSGEKWRLVRDEHWIDIRYYDFKTSDHTFTIDGEVVTRNVVIIAYETLKL